MEGENGQQIQRQGLCQGHPCPLVSTPPPGLAPTDRPPPELQKPFHHTIPAPLSTLQGNKPPGLSLGSLASEHLKTQPSLGLENLMPGSLGALSLHQMSAKCDSGRMKAPSLGSLASNHLDSGGLVPSLASMTVSPSTSLATTNGEQSLGGLTANHLTGLKTIGSSPTLGGLAGTHLSSEKSASLSNSGQNNSSFSLGSLASSHLQVVGKSSLGDLASNHLSTIPAGSSLGSLASNHLSTMPSTGPSLGSLAAVHLSNTNLSLGSQSSNCREKKSSDTSIAEPVVDLTSALKPNSLEPATPVPVLRKGMQVRDTLPNFFFLRNIGNKIG